MSYTKTDNFPEPAVRTARLAKAIAHPARIIILQHLASQTTCICGDIVDELPLSQATVSQHLKALKEAGLINGQVDGPRVCYRLNKRMCQTAFHLLRDLFLHIKCC